jgi:hypothetical protein
LTSWLLTYSDDRELDFAALAHLKNLKLLKTGVGKVQAATNLSSYLTSSLRTGQDKPEVISVGTCVALEGGSAGNVIEPQWAIDRDVVADVLEARGLTPPPSVRLAGVEGVHVGSGDALLTSRDLEMLGARGINWVDTDAHSLGWVSIRCLAGRTRVVRYVTHSVESGPPKDWAKALELAKQALTTSVLQLTAEGTAA